MRTVTSLLTNSGHARARSIRLCYENNQYFDPVVYGMNISVQNSHSRGVFVLFPFVV